MRILRRGVIAQRKGGYVWAVYTLVPGVDESVFTTGSFTMAASFGSTPSLMAADGYTVDSSGKITLTSAVSTKVSALTAGKYIVSISSSSSTATTSTQYVYKVTDVTSSGSTWSTTYTVSYERYEVSLAMKGTDTGNRVESTDGTAYPHNGVQGDYWYVLLRGWTSVHVWDVFNVTTKYGYKENTVSTAHTTMWTSTDNMFYSSTREFDVQKGTWTLVNPSSKMVKNLTVSDLKNKYFDNTSSTITNYIYYNATAVEQNASSSSTINITCTRIGRTQDSSVQVPSKGTSTGETVQSVDENAYPQDGKQNNYWYVYSGIEDVYIDNT